jgi:uncharacterized membrane protein
VTAYWSDAMTLSDVGSDPTSPSLVGSYSSSTYINGASRIAYDATNRYVYVTAEVSDAMTIIDVGRTVVLYLAPPSPAPTNLPTTVPTTAPSIDPTAVPSLEPTAIPTLDPTSTPTALPTTAPTSLPTISSLPTEYGLMNSGATSADLATQGKQYTGTILTQLGYMTMVTGNFDLYGNDFTGAVPTELGGIALLYILQIIVTALSAQRDDGPEYLLRRKNQKPLTMRRYEASDTFHQHDRRKMSNKQEPRHGVSTGWRSGRRYSMSACFMLVLVVSSSCISIAQAIDDNTPGFGSKSSTRRTSQKRFRKTRDRSLDKASYYGDGRLSVGKGADDSIAASRRARGDEGKSEGEGKHEAIATMAIGAEDERMNQRQRRLTSEGHDEQIGSSGHRVQRVSENRGDDRAAPAENQSSGDGE